MTNKKLAQYIVTFILIAFVSFWSVGSLCGIISAIRTKDTITVSAEEYPDVWRTFYAQSIPNVSQTSTFGFRYYVGQDTKTGFIPFMIAPNGEITYYYPTGANAYNMWQNQLPFTINGVAEELTVSYTKTTVFEPTTIRYQGTSGSATYAITLSDGTNTLSIQVIYELTSTFDYTIPFVASNGSISSELYQQGYNEGYDYGYNLGKSDGYNEGYNYAYDIFADQEYTFSALFFAILDTPVKVITGLFNFEIFGFNMLTFVRSLFTVLVVFILLKFLIQGASE